MFRIVESISRVSLKDIGLGLEVGVTQWSGALEEDIFYGGQEIERALNGFSD